MSGGDFFYIFQRPIALCLLILLVLSFAAGPLSRRLRRITRHPHPI
jgi:hypothetical protein